MFEFEYVDYANCARRLFDYMNGRVNVLNPRCELDIVPFDCISDSYGAIRFPNHVTIYVGTIMNGWNDEWSKVINKRDFICSCIAWAVSHELHHADQLISMIAYNHDSSYKKRVESDVEVASYDWVVIHKDEISQVGGFNCLLHEITSPVLKATSNYTKANVKQFYWQTIANIIIRDLDAYAKCTMFMDKKDPEDIVIKFNGQDPIAIKHNGEYIEENIPRFSELAFKWFGGLDRYTITIGSSYDTTEYGTICYVNFSSSSCITTPIVFMEGHNSEG